MAVPPEQLVAAIPAESDRGKRAHGTREEIGRQHRRIRYRLVVLPREILEVFEPERGRLQFGMLSSEMMRHGACMLGLALPALPGTASRAGADRTVRSPPPHLPPPARRRPPPCNARTRARDPPPP